MTIVTARYQNKQVEILDTLQANGRKLAIIKAMEGQRFQSWTHGGWCESDTATVRADLLQNVRKDEQDPQPAPAQPNLLALALAHQDRQQWPTSEIVQLWGNGKASAYLKSEEMQVVLYVRGYGEGLPVFTLDPWQDYKWRPVNDLQKNYHRWARQAQKTLDKKRE